MKSVRPCLLAADTLAVFASTALAQSDIAPRTAVSFVGGAGSSSSTTGVTLGGSWLFDLNDRASLEAQGTYLDRGAGAAAVSVNGSLLANLVSRRQRIVPYAASAVACTEPRSTSRIQHSWGQMDHSSLLAASCVPHRDRGLARAPDSDPARAPAPPGWRAIGAWVKCLASTPDVLAR